MRYIDLHLRYITLHYIEDSCGFQWRDVDAVTLEFPLDLHSTSLEYFCYHRVEFWQIKNILEKITAVVSLTLGYG